jgi:hypothetical protein
VLEAAYAILAAAEAGHAVDIESRVPKVHTPTR